MPFTKFASYEVSDILEVKGAPTRVREASFNKLADFEDYRTEDGYLYARIRAISSRVNKNHDGWPSVELAGGSDIFDKHRYAAEGGGFTIEAKEGAKYGFSTFLGKPIFVDHNNSDPDRARGVVVDAKFHIEDQKTASKDPYYSSSNVDPEHTPPAWIELLLEVDANSFPKFAKAILEGSKDSSTGIDGFSLGCNVERSVCNICKNSATAPDEFCNHIRMKGAMHNYRDDEGNRKTAKSYENCYGVQFFEISGVFDPADETALTREVRASVQKEADQRVVPCPQCGHMANFSDSAGQGICPSCGHVMTGADTPAAAPSAKTSLPGTAPVPQNGMGMAPMVPMQQPRPGVNANVHTADNPPPQSDLITAPDTVDTLREEQTCPICGEKLEDGSCDLCGYIEPPDKFDNPDLNRAEEVNELPAQSGPDGSQQKIIPQGDDLAAAPMGGMTPHDVPGTGPNKAMAVAHVRNDMQWKVVPDPRTAGRINKVERPILPGNSPQTNEPNEVVVKDPDRPVTSHVHTASDLIASVGRDQENTMERVAEQSATPADASAAPDKRIDVDGTGGIMDASNEQASKADAQVPVDGVGGTGVEGVEADGHASVEQTSDNAGFQPGGKKGPPTKTWNGTGGNSITRQQSPVTNQVFKGGSAEHTAYDSGSDNEENPDHPNKAVQGVKPVAEQFGERVNLLEPLTSPENNSGHTTQWTGTDGNGVTKQQDPTTQDVYAPWTSKVVAAVKLAETEIELGLLPASQKWARITELEGHEDIRIATELAYAERVRTAGLKAPSKVVKKASTEDSGATKLPVLGRPSAMRSVSASVPKDDPMGGTLFGL